MSKSITPISRREVLIGGAAAVASQSFPFRLLSVNLILQALLRRKNKLEEKLT